MLGEGLPEKGINCQIATAKKRKQSSQGTTERGREGNAQAEGCLSKGPSKNRLHAQPVRKWRTTRPARRIKSIRQREDIRAKMTDKWLSQGLQQKAADLICNRGILRDIQAYDGHWQSREGEGR